MRPAVCVSKLGNPLNLWPFLSWNVLTPCLHSFQCVLTNWVAVPILTVSRIKLCYTGLMVGERAFSYCMQLSANYIRGMLSKKLLYTSCSLKKLEFWGSVGPVGAQQWPVGLWSNSSQELSLMFCVGVGFQNV